jgi:hypothetical protein
MGSVDLYQLEKDLARKTTGQIRTGLRSAIQQTTKAVSGGFALKTANSRAVFKDDRLQRIVIKAPHYIFKQQYGFEGRKSNGVNMRLRATDVITQTLVNSRVMETLADEISEIRLSQITAKINFK